MRPELPRTALRIRPRPLVEMCLLAVLCSIFVAPVVHAQYMYLDSNGDGIHTAEDVVSPTGTTTFDIWIRTNLTRDGVPKFCSSGDGPLDIRSYQFILHAEEGTVSWGPYSNAQPEAFPSSFGSEFDTTDAFVSFGGFGALPPGTYKLGTLTLTIRSGTPFLTIAPVSSLSDGYLTAFGSTCSGSDFDGFIKLGPNVIGPGDWTDVDGLEYGGIGHHTPVLAPIPDLIAVEGTPLDIPLSATDLDGDPLTFSKIDGPPFMEVSTLEAGVGSATGSIRLTPGFGDSGVRPATVAVSDGTRTAQASFSITVLNVDRPPVMSALGDMVAEEDGSAFQDIRVSDPDGQPVSVAIERAPSYVVLLGTGPIVVLLAEPGEGFGGRADSVAVMATSAMLQVRDTCVVTVLHLPTLTPPADMTVSPNTTAEQILTASDADGDPLTFLRGSFRGGDQGPNFVSVTTTSGGTGTASGLIRVSPGPFDLGRFEVVVSVNDGRGSAEAVFHVTVNPTEARPALFSSRFLAFDVARDPSRAVMGDFNNDGRSDVAIASEGQFSTPGGLTVLLGVTGGFSSPLTFILHATPRCLASGDFDSDGNLDLALGFGPTVEIWRGNGNGTFIMATQTYTIPSVWDLGVVDLNEDGHPDLVAIDNSQAFLRVWLNDGQGAFGAPSDSPTGGFPFAMAFGDLDRDGHQDVAVASLSDSAIDVFHGSGNGALVHSLTLPVFGRTLAIRDVNGDAFGDLVVAGNRVSVFLGSASGIGTAQEDFDAGATPTGLSFEDFNHDGRLDVAVANATSDSASILLGDGLGRFSRQWLLGTARSPLDVFADDIDRDGVPDLVTVNGRSGTVSVAMSHGDGSFGDARQILVGIHPAQAVSGDFTGDGRLDLALYDPDAGLISIRYGMPGGIFGPGPSWPARVYGKTLATGDLNGDGRADLIWSDSDRTSVSVVLSQGSTWSPRLDLPVHGLHGGLAVADLNHDETLDLVVGSKADDVTEHAQVLLGRGDGTFVEGATMSVAFFATSAILSGDLNGDGITDVLAMNFNHVTVVFPFLGQGDGTFVPGASFQMDVPASRAVLHDLNQDGVLDIAMVGAQDLVSNPVPGSVSVALGLGNGTFTFPTGFRTGYTATSFAIADFNSDGHPDFGVSDGDGNSASILLGNGDGSFGTAVDLGVGGFPSDIIATDLNGDGRPDLVTCDRGSGTLTLLENRIGATPNRAPTAVAGGPYSGVADVPVAFNGSGSSDPEGSPLTFHWMFGDGIEATGAKPVHTYHAEGHFDVTLTVSDGSLEGEGHTAAEITAALQARAFVPEGKHPVIAGRGAPYTSLDVEPVGGAYENADVVAASIRLRSEGTGSVSEIAAVAGRRTDVLDRDGNGIAEISVSFARDDLGRLFSLLHGKHKVPVSLEGSLVTGARFRASLEITVVGPGGPPFTAVSVNPIRAGSTLTLFQPRSGPLRVQVFDSAGRLVRTLADRTTAEAGFMDLPLDGRGQNGGRLPSGIYFYKVMTAEGEATGRIVILR